MAHLTLEQVELAWTFAQPIPNEDPSEVRQDFLGAHIHREDYGNNSQYGWVAEYILNKEFLGKHASIKTDIFCKENVRIWFVGNFYENAQQSARESEAWYTDENGQNKKNYVAFIYPLTQQQKDKLKERYGLTDEIINSL